MTQAITDAGAAAQAASAHLTRMLREQPQRLRRRSISLGVPVSDADDAAQNAALRAWRSLSALRSTEEATMCAWLDTIARTTAIDMNRARNGDLGEVMCDRLESGQSVEREAELHDQLSSALRAIEDLPDELRRPLVLSVVEGLTGPEIASHLGVSAAAVRQRIARARRSLRDAVGE